MRQWILAMLGLSPLVMVPVLHSQEYTTITTAYTTVTVSTTISTMHHIALIWFVFSFIGAFLLGLFLAWILLRQKRVVRSLRAGSARIVFLLVMILLMLNNFWSILSPPDLVRIDLGMGISGFVLAFSLHLMANQFRPSSWLKLEDSFTIDSGEQTICGRLTAGMARLGYKRVGADLPLKFQRGSEWGTWLGAISDKLTYTTIQITSNGITTSVNTTLTVPHYVEGFITSRVRNFWKKELGFIKAIALGNSSEPIESFESEARKMATRDIATLSLGIVIMVAFAIIAPSFLGEHANLSSWVFVGVSAIPAALFLILIVNAIRHLKRKR